MSSHAGEPARPRVGGLARAIAAVPEAFLWVLAVATAVGVTASWAGLRPLASTGASRLIAAALIAVASTSVISRVRDRDGLSSGLLPAVPAGVLVGYAVAVRLLSPGDRAEWFLGGDHVRHLIFVADEHATGSLDYAVQPYPRAWHTLVATLWSATGAQVDEAGLRSLVDLMSSAVWLLPALLSLAMGFLTVEVAERTGASRTQSGVAGLAIAAAMLLPPFLANYQALGFENSYVGAIVLAVVAKEVVAVDGRRPLRSPLVAVAGVAVCAHSWQLLLPAAGVAFMHLAWPTVRRGSAGDRVALMASALLGATVALPALLAVFTVIGLEHATDSGVRAPVPVTLLVGGLICSVVLAYWRRRDSSLRALVAVVLLPSVTAVAVAVRVGIPLSDYYPSKLLWHSAVLGLSPLAVVLVRGWVVVRRHAPPRLARAVRGAGGAVAGLTMVLALVQPVGAFVGAWSSVRGPRTLDAITSAGAGDAQVVWLGDRGDDTIGRVLLDFYRVPAPGRTPQPPLDVDEECALLAAAARPTVLSNRPDAEVRARYSCSPGLVVVPADD